MQPTRFHTRLLSPPQRSLLILLDQPTQFLQPSLHLREPCLLLWIRRGRVEGSGEDGFEVGEGEGEGCVDGGSEEIVVGGEEEGWVELG